MHRPSIEGFENLPASGPFLLVANHSGGFAVSELMSLAVLWLERFGRDRRLAGLAHPFGFNVWPIVTWLRGLGAIPSTYEAAAKALGDGIAVIVFPGGELESGRPVWRANQVEFGGRKGFLKIAREARVPIVPMGIRGSHYSVPIVWQSRHVLPWLVVIPRLFGIKRFPLTLLGVAAVAAIVLLTAGLAWPWRVGLAWAFLLTPLQFLPWVPSTIRMRIGSPISHQDLFGAAQGSEDLSAAYARVIGEVQRLVDGLTGAR
jgi:1-acyl-sn-glycerol-3-phosphate acyltransferase